MLSVEVGSHTTVPPCDLKPQVIVRRESQHELLRSDIGSLEGEVLMLRHMLDRQGEVKEALEEQQLQLLVIPNYPHYY